MGATNTISGYLGVNSRVNISLIRYPPEIRVT